MIRIDFAFGAPDKWQMACLVLQKHVAAGRRLLVVADDPAILNKIDKKLWAFQDTSFLTHAHAGDPLAAYASLLLLDTSEAQTAPGLAAPCHWVMNLGRTCAPPLNGVQRILEVVSNHEGDRHLARQRWQQYKQLGYQLKAHNVG